MNVTLRQLRAFASVYRARSITRAARELSVTLWLLAILSAALLLVASR